jgi:ATP-binding cassette subfamily B protein
VLILDECLSAVDAETEKRILDDLRQLGSDVTIILISHRSYLHEWADRVVTMSHVQLLVDDNVSYDRLLTAS